MPTVLICHRWVRFAYHTDSDVDGGKPGQALASGMILPHMIAPSRQSLQLIDNSLRDVLRQFELEVQPSAPGGLGLRVAPNLRFNCLLWMDVTNGSRDMRPSAGLGLHTVRLGGFHLRILVIRRRFPHHRSLR
jgi:hypothetical protein